MTRAFEFGELITTDGTNDTIDVLVITENGVSLPIELEFAHDLARLRDQNAGLYEAVWELVTTANATACLDEGLEA